MDFRVLSAEQGVARQHEASRKVDDALCKGGSKPCKAITDYLTAVDAKFDIFILPTHIQNGSMNSITDDGGDSGNDARRCYEAAGLTWLERPTIFWNPTCSVRIYSDVSGTKDVGQVSYTRMQLRDAPRGQDKRTLIYRKPIPGNRFTDKVVILATELTLDPWIVLFHELGHMKQYFTVVGALRQAAHSGPVEAAWALKAFGGNSCEPENLELHENPITEFHCARQSRRRYYHDGFHFGQSTGHDGWMGGALNYGNDLTTFQDNFIFSNLAKQANFMKSAETFPTAPPVGAGYYWVT